MQRVFGETKSVRPGLLFFFGCVAVPLCAEALPIERFETPLDLKCAHDSICTQTVRSKYTLGGTTGVVLIGGNEGSASLRFSQSDGRKAALSADGEGVHSLALHWDGDANPEQLSGAGLGCFDLTGQGATSVVIRDLGLTFECADPDEEGGCPPVELELRMYDADDATGQRFSAAVTKLRSPRAADELVIPFADFTKEGPRGLARLTCVGAITMRVRFEGFKDVELSVGPIFTNGTDGLTSIPTATPTHTPIQTTSPAPTEALVTPKVIVTAASPVVTGIPVDTPAATPAGVAEVPLLPGAESDGTSRYEPAAVPKLIAPKVGPQRTQVPAPVDEEGNGAVYGSVLGSVE
jgi:hypothetical protein